MYPPRKAITSGSAFKEYVDVQHRRHGCLRKRGIAVSCPSWNPITVSSAVAAPMSARMLLSVFFASYGRRGGKRSGRLQYSRYDRMPGYKFTVAVSALDCVGCGSCANVCPGKKGNKALTMANTKERIPRLSRSSITLSRHRRRRKLLRSSRSTRSRVLS
jgi:pyruvate-ferredoxin/flavodoxin oxidoreductase